MNIYDQVNSLSDDDLLRLCRVLTCAPGDEMKIYHSRYGTGHQRPTCCMILAEGGQCMTPLQRKGRKTCSR